MYSKKIVKDHFDNISNHYDINNQKLYWKLCDELLWWVIQQQLPKDRPFTFLDLGGGTGEWSLKILENYPMSSGTLVDFSKGMLEVANRKLSKYQDRIRVIFSDIDTYEVSTSVDFILNIYVLPFYNQTSTLFLKISRLLKSGGRVISVAENYYNGLALNILKGEIEKIYTVVNKKEGSLSKYVPPLYFHKVEEIEEVYETVGINTLFKCGIPVISMIGVKEVLTGKDLDLNSILQTNFYDIYKLELEYMSQVQNCNRGKYICVVGEKK